MVKMVAIGWYTHGPSGQQHSIFVFGTIFFFSRSCHYTLGGGWV
jgi:hypothetical protein